MTSGLRCASTIAFLAAAVVSVGNRLPAEIFTFESVAEPGDPIPDGGGATFWRFGSPIVSDGTIVFSGQSATNVGGIYANSGGTTTSLANTSTPIPDGTGTFTSVGNVSVSDGTVLFSGQGAASQSGIYTVPVTGGTPATTANQNTPVPGGSGNFDFLVGGAIAGNTAAILGRDSINDQGIYATSGGGLQTIADESTLMPGTATIFEMLSAPAVAPDGSVVFRGHSGTAFDSPQGIYSGSGGALTTIVDSTTTMPGSTGTFATLSTPSVSSDGTIAFSATGTEVIAPQQNFAGIFTSQDGVLSTIADTSTLTPDGTTFAAFSQATLTPIWEDTVAFLGIDLMDPTTAREALYISRAGTIYQVLTVATQVLGSNTWVGEQFDGRTLALILLSRNAIEGDTLAFTAVFEGGSMGVYTTDLSVAAVPEPSSLVLLGLTSVITGGAGWRRLRNRLRPAGQLRRYA